MQQTKISMNKIAFLLLLLTSFGAFAQKPCEIDVDVNDSIGAYKSTKAYMIFERDFAGNATNITFSLTNTNGVLGVEMQHIQTSPDFIKASCLDTNSKIYLQLNNGKIVTLIYAGNGSCGSLLQNEKKQNVRIMSGTFVFSKENYQDLKLSPVTYMRIKFAGETVDYPFRTGFVSNVDKVIYEPENYFVNYLKCIEN